MWMLDELAHAGDEHLDEDYVAAYEHKAGFEPAEEIEVLQRHGLTPDSVVVDLGCGTGVFAIAVAPLCRQVIAVDVSPAMVRQLRQRVADAGVTNVVVQQAGFMSYEHDGPPADIVYSRHALHQVPDFWKAIALSRIAHVLRPGGILRVRDLIYDFAPSEAGTVFEAWFANASKAPGYGWSADELAEHIRLEHSTFTWLLEPMFDQTGFDIVEHDLQVPTYGAYVCRRR
jgi:ubiquinone/menaquinone biosynthesis C-methylase UbiE